MGREGEEGKGGGFPCTEALAVVEWIDLGLREKTMEEQSGTAWMNLRFAHSEIASDKSFPSQRRNRISENSERFDLL